MAKRLQHRGGTTSQHSTFTGAVREVTVDTDKNTLVVHDGATAGGHALPTITGTETLTNKTLTSPVFSGTATNFTSTGIDDNATSTAITIDSSERVGIGTSSPTEELTISTKSGSTSVPDAISLGSSYSNSAGTPSKLKVKVYDAGGDNVNGLGHSAALMNIVSGIESHSIGFFTTPSGGSSTERMRIDSSGNVGIGTSSPGADLHISGSGSVIRFTDEANSQSWQWQAANDRFEIRDVTQAVERFTVLSTGEIGIGTTTPDRPLTVKEVSNVAISVIKSSGQDILHIGEYGGGGQATYNSILNGAHIFLDNGTERMRIDSSGNVSVGTTTPYGKLNVSGGTSTDLFVVSGFTGGETNYNMSIRNPSTNKIAFRQRWFTTSQNDQEVMNFTSGNVNVVGAFSKGSGSFKINHPLPEKTNTHHLVHSFVEAPQADNIYRGKINLVNGTATVNIDTVAGMTEGTFVLLNRDIQCFTSNETGWTVVKGSVSGNTLTITAQDNTCTDTISWMVIGERQDQHMYDTNWTDDNGKVIVEPLKETETQP